MRQVPTSCFAVEVDEWWTERLWEGVKAQYPHKVCYPLSNGYGLALFSRLEIVLLQISLIGDDAIPSILAEVKLRSGAEIAVYGVHPRPPAVGHKIPRNATWELLLVAQEI